MEIERRLRAEEALSLWQNLWQEMMEKFSLVGVSLPSIEVDGAHQEEEARIDGFVDDFCGQLTIARTVSNAVGRASIRAELENEMKALIDNKNIDISRLRDKLQCYELVNHEMSQQNQEATEVARRCRRRQKQRKRWIWSSCAVSVVIGTTAVVLRRNSIPHWLK